MVVLENLTVDTNLSVEACTSITAGNSFEILAPSSTTLVAGSYVEFVDEFSIGAGATVSVGITP